MSDLQDTFLTGLEGIKKTILHGGSGNIPKFITGTKPVENDGRPSPKKTVFPDFTLWTTKIHSDKNCVFDGFFLACFSSIFS
uniref:Uncharacterized protein n=1 Tax=Oryzias sinensis TaxID=183150 RepID=A0A8C7YGA3_9TELE